MLEFKKINLVDIGDWDYLVQETYGKPYNFQQQGGCKSRGTETFQVPNENPWDYEEEAVPYKINGDEMGVSFQAWLNKGVGEYEDIFWERNFYPSLEILAQDLYEKGLIPAGDYTIEIDW